MRKILGLAVCLFAGAANAQEVIINQYVGDDPVGSQVYGRGYLSCSVTANECKLGDGIQDFDARPPLTGGGGVSGDFYPLDGDVGYFDDDSADTVSGGTWTPTATGFVRIKANVTAGPNLTINPPTGTLGTGLAPKILEVTNSSGGDLTVTFTGYSAPTDYITTVVIGDTEVQEFHIDTNDTGSTWRLLTGYLDFSSLPASGALDGTELAICQKGGAWTQCTTQAVGDLGGGGGGSGESNTSTDVGAGAYSTLGTVPKVGTALQFKTIDAGGGIVIDDTSDVLTFSQGARTRVEVTGTSTLTDPQVFQTILTNFGMTAGGDTTLPAYAGSTSFTLMVEAAGQSWSIRPPSGERFALNNTLLDVDDKIDISQGIGDSATLLRIKTSATPTYAWYFYIAAGNHTDGGP